MNQNHQTGYLYQADAGIRGYGQDEECWGDVESWHRTFAGALRAKARNHNRGGVYKITGDDTSHKVS